MLLAIGLDCTLTHTIDDSNSHELATVRSKGTTLLYSNYVVASSYQISTRNTFWPDAFDLLVLLVAW